jgi:hypothetical protein
MTLKGVKVLKWYFVKFKILRWHETNIPLYSEGENLWMLLITSKTFVGLSL